MSRGKHGPIGLDLGARHVKAAQLRRARDGTLTVEALATFPRAGPSENPCTIDATEARRVGDVLFRRGFVGRELVLAVPDERLMTASLELPPRSADVPLDQIARAEFARTLKADSDAFEFAYWDLPAPARASRATHVMGVGCLHAHAEPVIDAFADSGTGLEVVGLDVGPCALTRAAAAWIAADDEITALVDVGWGAARLLVAHRGVVCYQRGLPGYGVERLKRALGDQLGVDNADLLDHLLRHVSLDSDAAVGAVEAAVPTPQGPAAEEAQRAMRAHLDAVLAEVVTSLAYSSHQYPDAAARRVLLCGGGANFVGAGKYLSARHKLDVRAVRPADATGLAPALARSVESTDSALMLALGLARHDDVGEPKARAAA
jgi:Tfp pilus assembly PilM family ATPase